MEYFFRKKKDAINVVITIVFIIVLLSTSRVQAATEAEMLDNGDFTFTTTDTAATNITTWSTIGFTVRREETKGNPLIDKNYATFMIKRNQKNDGKVRPDGKKEVTFYLTKQQVNDALSGTSLENIKDNDDLYLNGIIEVKNGKKPGPFYTLDSISKAEPWRDASDFDDRFDIHIKYRSGNQEYPVTITHQLYQSGKYNTIKVSNEGKIKNHDDFKTDWKNIPQKQVNGSETYYLYRVYYQNLKSTKKLGNRKTAIDPNVDKDTYLEELKYIRDRTFTMQGAKEGDGLNIVAIYRRFPQKGDIEDAEEVVREYEETDPTALIGADTRGNEEYEVDKGIPGTEKVYANTFTSNYLAGSTFTRTYGKKIYNVKVQKTYHLNWTTSETVYDPVTKKDVTTTEEHSETRNMTYMYPVERKYSYWTISSLGVYGIDKAILNNQVLPGGNVTLNPGAGYKLPEVTYIQGKNESDHIIEPTIKDVIMPAQTLSGTGAAPSIPSEEFKTEADNAVTKIKCKNDKLVFNGQVIMSDTLKEEKTDSPKEIPSGLADVGQDVLYKPGMVIPGETANGEYKTTGTVSYKPVIELNPSEVDLNYELLDVNSVVVHTPTVCDAQIQSNYKDNQMIKPDVTRASLILDKPFYVTLPTTGNHQYYRGYGYKDYGKYIASREVKFPFDVYKGSSVDGTFLSAGTWTSVSEDTQFYLPTWVTEGQYTIQFRSTAINSSANAGADKTEVLANLEIENYVATDTIDVEISGRVYGLNLYDISDYPTWENVFRLPNSLKLSGFKYTVGTKDQNGNNNGQSSKYTLTPVNGSHPQYQNIGAIKTGYVTRFSLKTVGSMSNEKDYIRIIPTFYYVDKKGQNRQKVDIYYSETFNGKKNIMVKMGSPLDLENKKALRTGDVFLAISEKELYQTSVLKGISKESLMGQKRNVFTFTNIMLPESLRTFVGYLKNVPSTVNKDNIAKSVQNWYGEYYLPGEIHVVPKDFDLTGYIRNNGALTYKEPIWLKNGYIIVNFEIETIKDGKRHLSYINAENAKNGYCNMWSREGFLYEKTDWKGNKFNFQDGDYVLYYTDKSVSDDYISAGTH